ncbi:MAG: hypothetical protein HOV81_17630 [Kofleriaceae bacterium]|nr:hypothetical protein [Kofleriaceae bacterium]
MRLSVMLLLFASACAPSHEDVVGPYTGEARRYVIDEIRVPMSNSDARTFAADLNGDGVADNGLGGAIAFLASQDNVTSHGNDMIRVGVIASSVIVTADDLTTDDAVSVRYLATDDDDTAIEVGGRFVDGAFEPNRTAWTHVPGAATVRVPVFVDADPTTVRLDAVEIELEPDDSGYWATVRGVVADPIAAAYPGLKQMVEERPYDHPYMLEMLDFNPRDGVVTLDEVSNSSIVASLLAPDGTYRGTKGASFAFKAHLTACAEGSCQTPQPSCFDRVLDGTETHLDCGGNCRGCTEGASCTVAGDCESRDCTDGVCGPPSCVNGLRDGTETAVDCGGTCAAKCGTGMGCRRDGDCSSGQCGEPCEGFLCGGDGWSEDTCR